MDGDTVLENREEDGMVATRALLKRARMQWMLHVKVKLEVGKYPGASSSGCTRSHALLRAGGQRV